MKRSRFESSLAFRVVSLSIHTFSSNNITGWGRPFEFRGKGVILTKKYHASMLVPKFINNAHDNCLKKIHTRSASRKNVCYSGQIIEIHKQDPRKTFPHPLKSQMVHL